jgi:hypothetical protein
MELLIMLLVPLPLGFLIPSRVVAYLTFVGVHSFTFTFQTLALTREWVGGDTAAFDRDPTVAPWAYGLVNLIIYAAGLGLVALGHKLADRRRQRKAKTVDLAAA